MRKSLVEFRTTYLGLNFYNDKDFQNMIWINHLLSVPFSSKLHSYSVETFTHIAVKSRLKKKSNNTQNDQLLKMYKSYIFER